MRQEEQTEEGMLITRARQGNVEAFESLVKKYQYCIYSLCRQMTGAHQSADDLSQETFIKAYFALHTFKDGMSFFTWIRKIALNSTLNFLKSKKREEPLGRREETLTGPSTSSGGELPQEKLQRNQLEQKFTEALRALPPEQKAVFILRVFEDLSYNDISEVLKIPRGTVMSRLNRARKRLREEMLEYL